MFTLKLFDRLGQELKMGDIVRISDGHNFKFYSEVKYLPDQKVITPFHTFTFHSFERVDKLPDNAIESTETRYKIWWIPDAEVDQQAKEFEHYLMSWRECERLLEKNVFRIEPLFIQQKLF